MTPHVITMPKTVKLCDTRFYSHDSVSLIWKLWLQFSYGYDFILYQRELLMNVLSFQRILRILRRASSPDSTFQHVNIFPMLYPHLSQQFNRLFVLVCITIQYIPRNMHTVFALLCFVVVIHWLISPYPSGLLHWHCGNLTIAPVPAKQPWWIWIKLQVNSLWTVA